jgi:hypothetical protein
MWKGKTNDAERLNRTGRRIAGPIFTGKLKEKTAFHRLFLHKF